VLPPTVLFGADRTTPTALYIGADPSALVPMKFPSTKFPVVLNVEHRTPVELLPEITLRGARDSTSDGIQRSIRTMTTPLPNSRAG